MQNIVRFLEQRGQQNIPDLDDIEYRQQATAFFPGAISAIASTILAAIFFLADLTSLAWFTLFIGASQAASVVIATYRPQFTTGAGTMLGLVTVLGNLGIHAEAGGYDAELWALAWLPILPLAVFLTAGPRGGAIVLIVAISAVALAAFLDPLFAQSPLEIPRTLLLGYNTFTLVTAALIALLWSLYLFGELESARLRVDELLLNILPAPIAARGHQHRSGCCRGHRPSEVHIRSVGRRGQRG